MFDIEWWRPPHRANLLRVLTLWLPIYSCYFILSVLWMIIWPPEPGASNGPGLFFVIAILHLFTVADALYLLLLYGLHVMRSDRYTPVGKLLWGVFMFSLGVIALPLYWHLHVVPFLREFPLASAVESIPAADAR